MSPRKQTATRSRAAIVYRNFFLTACAILPVILLPSIQQSFPGNGPYSLCKQRLYEIVAGNRDLVYLPSADALVMTVAKGGSSSMWHWLYTGLTGRAKYNSTKCATYVQNISSECWGREAMYVHELDKLEQRRVVCGEGTLRLAVQRDPFERLLSSYKSKFTCEHKMFRTDLRNRATMVPKLLRQAGMEQLKRGCLTVGEFAEALERVRRRVGTVGGMKSLRETDVHIRPSNYFFEEIQWDLVLDVEDLGNARLLQPLVRRLKFGNLVADGPGRRHSSGKQELMLSERAARLLHRFAMETEIGERRIGAGDIINDGEEV